MYQITNKKIGEKKVRELIRLYLLNLTKFYTYDTPTKLAMETKDDKYFFIIRHNADTKNREVQHIYPISKTAYHNLVNYITDIMRFATYMNNNDMLRDNSF